MPKLKVDGIEIEVSAGATVLQVRADAIPGHAIGLQISMTHWPFALTIGALALTGSAACAADTEEAEVRKVVAGYANCLAKKSHDKARRYLIVGGIPPMSPDCVPQVGPSGLKFPGENYRYALAEALMKYDFGSALPTGISTVPKSNFGTPQVSLQDRPNKKEIEKRTLRANVFWILNVVGDCVARADPTAAQALALSDVLGPAENAAFTVLTPSIARCIPPGKTMRFTRSSLRGAIALNLYLLAYRASTAFTIKSGEAHPVSRKPRNA